MMDFVLFIGLCIALLEVTSASEACYNSYYRETYYCEYGCCGDGWDRDCCSLAGIIAGCVIGGIFLIAIIVTVVCCCMKQKGRSGRTINAAPTATNAQNVTVISPGQSYYQQPQPPPYGQFYPAQPAYLVAGAPVPATAPLPPFSAPGMNQDPAYPTGVPPEYKQ